MMKFNEALKAKREEAGLSIADISERTRLTERYIRALEDRDIHAFADDLSYLRYFVRSYCDAVQVDYNEIKDDVLQAVREYEEERDLALTQTHLNMEKHIQGAESLTKVNKTADGGKGKGPKLAKGKRYNRLDASFLSFVAVVLVVLIVVAFAFVICLRPASKPDTSEPSVSDQPPQQEPAAEEPVVREEMRVEKTGTASYTVHNVYADDVLKFKLTPGGSSILDMRVDGVSTKPEKQVYSAVDPYEYELKVEKSCEVQIDYGYMFNNKIEINDQELEIDASLLATQGSAQFTIKIEMVE